MLLDAQRADLVVQRRGIEAELRRRTGRSCYTSAALGERRLDHLPLTGRQLVTERTYGLRRFARQPAQVDGERVGVADDDRPLEDVLQLAHVPGPAVGFHEVERLLVNATDGLA